jgi:hypothetical protein
MRENFIGQEQVLTPGKQRHGRVWLFLRRSAAIAWLRSLSAAYSAAITTVRDACNEPYNSRVSYATVIVNVSR